MDPIKGLPPECQRAFNEFGGKLDAAWDHCADLMALVWLAAVFKPRTQQVVDEIDRVRREIENAHVYPFPDTSATKAAGERLRQQLARAYEHASNGGVSTPIDHYPLDGSKPGSPMRREDWAEYFRAMNTHVEAVRKNLRDVVVPTMKVVR